VDQPPTHDADRQTPVTGARAPLSILAVIALVVAVVPLCPFTGLLGAFLGILALRRIRFSGGRLGGHRVALTAVIVGCAATFGWSMMLHYVIEAEQRAMQELMAERVALVINAVDEPSAAAAAEAWAEGAANRPSAESLRAFADAVRERYGPMDRFEIVSQANVGAFSRPQPEVAGVFHFQQQSRLGSARFTVSMTLGILGGKLYLNHLTIEDPELGDLTLGEPSATSADTGPDGG
jgi:hypothetical protein